MQLNKLLVTISFDTFMEIMDNSPRKVRESLYSHYGIKNKKKGLLSSLKDKKENKYKGLLEALKSATSEKEENFLKELLRNWLFTKRPLLKDTLDFLNVENDNGLIETEIEFFKELKPDQVKNLIDALKEKHGRDEMLVYFSFVEMPHFEKLLLG